MIFISIASPARAGLYIGRYIRTHSGARAQSRRSPWDRVLHALDRSGTGSAAWVALGHPALPLSCQVVVNPLEWPRAQGSFVCRICPQQARPLLSSSHKVWFAGLFISGVELDPPQAQNIQKLRVFVQGQTVQGDAEGPRLTWALAWQAAQLVRLYRMWCFPVLPFTGLAGSPGGYLGYSPKPGLLRTSSLFSRRSFSPRKDRRRIRKVVLSSRTDI
ncbi:hypothetical protein B0J15DRAFT_254559 [Fusarium solani]|jgi:hypothetical protein|uniref:Uncharacterized protein n=1 Tax=Fusarium solani TaxID=169388 RepID=A0A9P9KQF2_FUSSL|nr:uncharacterized protein B0J15DRAFT_254559 [Fusarium solani]KAH7266626.1 hypothetical protein B0J15DRAFT_254559 [Fusarium solani]